jgi:chromosome segregation ATPase
MTVSGGTESSSGNLDSGMENDMASKREEIDKILADLARQRDELRLKLSLAKLEARDEWEKLEKQWNHLRANAPQMQEELGAIAGGIGEAFSKAAAEVRDGYERLRRLL